MSLCAAPHPDLPVTCVAPERYPNHDSHFANHEGDQVEWQNPAYVPNVSGIDPTHRSIVKNNVIAVANRVRAGS